MLVIGLILNVFGIGLFCWLIFTLAVYALPFFIGLTAGMAAFHSGASILGSLFTGIGTGALALVIGQIAFAVIRSLTFRVIVAAAFTIPAAIAGYHAVLGLSQIGMPSLIWCEVFAWIGAILIGSTAWARMTVLAEPLPLTRASDRCRLGQADLSRGIRQRHGCAESGQPPGSLFSYAFDLLAYVSARLGVSDDQQICQASTSSGAAFGSLTAREARKRPGWRSRD